MSAIVILTAVANYVLEAAVSFPLGPSLSCLLY